MNLLHLLPILISACFLLVANACGPGTDPIYIPGSSETVPFAPSGSTDESESPEVRDGYCTPAFLDDYFGTAAEKAASVCFCESSGNPSVVSSNGLYVGLFQIDWQLHGYTVSQLQDPHFNASVASGLYQQSGWAPWPTCGA